MKGLVIKNTGSWYQVKTDDGQSIECKIKGNFRLKGIRSTNPVAVGDRVRIILNQEGTAFISEIEDRKNYIIRRSSNLSKQSHILAANLDQCMLVVTINYPETSTIFIDRFLASAEAYRVPVKLVFNKVDAYDEDELRYLDALINLYTQIGYPCFKVSAKNGTGVAEIKKALEGKITLFSGHSGVGKSTLINSILPGIGKEMAISSILRVSRASAHSIWKKKRSDIIFPKYSKPPPTANMATVHIVMNRDVPYAKQWKSTSSANPVIPLISICWKIKRKENIGLLIRKNASSVLIKPMLFTLIVIIVHTKKQYEKNLSFIMFHFIHNFRTCTILQY